MQYLVKSGNRNVEIQNIVKFFIKTKEYESSMNDQLNWEATNQSHEINWEWLNPDSNSDIYIM